MKFFSDKSIIERFNSWFFYKYLLFFMVICFSSCKNLDVPAPEREVKPFTYVPEHSEFIVPLNIYNKGLETVLNKNINGLLYEDSDLNDDNFEVKVWKKSPIAVSAAGNVISYKVPLKIWLKALVKFEKFGLNLSQEKETEFSITLNFKSRISIDNNWTIKTATEPNGYQWIEKPRLDVAGIPIPVTLFTDNLVQDQMKSFATIIDNQTGRNLDVRKELTGLWKKLQEPLLIAESPKTWLNIVPTSVSLSPLKGSDEKISALVGIKAFTETTVSDQPPGNPNLAIPDLETGNYKGGFFNVSLLTDIPYENATKIAHETLRGEEFFFGKNNRKSIRIDTISIYPKNDRLIVLLGVSGSVKGQIYFSGIPFFDSFSQKLLLKDFDFDIDTKNKILKSANWLAHGAFVSKIKPYFEYDLGPQLTESRSTIQRWLADQELTDNVFLNGSVDKLYPQKIFLTEKSIKAVISGNGKAELSIRSF